MSRNVNVTLGSVRDIVYDEIFHSFRIVTVRYFLFGLLVCFEINAAIQDAAFKSKWRSSEGGVNYKWLAESAAFIIGNTGCKKVPGRESLQR